MRVDLDKNWTKILPTLKLQIHLAVHIFDNLQNFSTKIQGCCCWEEGFNTPTKCLKKQ